MYKLGFQNNNPQPERALQLHTRAIAKGSVSAMNNLGLLLEKGAEGVPVDPAEAQTLYTRAIAKGYTPAMTYLGRLLEEGAEGVPADPDEAKRMFFQAAAAVGTANPELPSPHHPVLASKTLPIS